MKPNDERESVDPGVPREWVEDLERLAAPTRGKRERPLKLNELPTGRRRDFRILFFLGNGLFLTGIIFCSRYLGGVGQYAVIGLWLFYNLMLVYVMYAVMSRY